MLVDTVLKRSQVEKGVEVLKMCQKENSFDMKVIYTKEKNPLYL